MGHISRKLCGFLLMFLIGFTSPSVFLLFPLSLCKVFDSISSNIDKVLSINPSVNVFVFVDFSIHHKDWLTYCHVNSAIIFLFEMTLLDG